MTDDCYKDVRLLLDFDGQTDGATTFVDKSKYVRPVVRSGVGPQIDTAFSQFGTGSCFTSSATTGLIIGGDGDQLNSIGKKNFTIEAFIRGTVEPSPDGYFLASGDTSPSPDNFGWGFLYRRTSNAISFRCTEDGVGFGTLFNYDLDTEGSQIGAAGLWNSAFHHVMVSRLGNQLWIGVDGEASLISESFTLDVWHMRNVGMTMFGVSDGASGVTNIMENVHFDSVRMTVGDDQGCARYTSASYTVPIANFPTEQTPLVSNPAILRRRRRRR